jgi:hypothetical protein
LATLSEQCGSAFAINTRVLELYGKTFKRGIQRQRIEATGGEPSKFHSQAARFFVDHGF